MTRRNLMYIVGILVLMGITSAVSVLAYTFLVGGSGEPSQPLSAPTLSLATPTSNPMEAQVNALSTQVAVLQAANATLVAGGASGATVDPVQAPGIDVTAEATAESTADPVDSAASAAPATAATLFRIVPDESKVQFMLTEVLNGQPATPTGVTNQVAGDILVDFNTPANSKVGTIRIDARSLTTDSEFRNRAIRAQILQSSKDEYEFIDFTPTAISGLPAQITVGQAVTFQITGDLKVRDITNSVTFDVTATATTEDRLEGTAKAQVTRAMYNLQIPSAPGVADVSEEVKLQIDFVATKVTQ
ncbi:MAG TPA: YceI family protein [Terriglobales bacterium]|nr:YceI family protein [Terriglobales bacterium]